MRELYDQIGLRYTASRRPDSRISARIRRQLAGASSLVNVGAGAGSYEPVDIPVTAVEPSAQMISQRHDSSNVVQARAEALPFPDGAFDAVLAVLTIHHWEDKKRGLEECARTARRLVVILTWDPSSNGFWLVQEYFPELLVLDRRIFPTMADMRAVLGRISVQPVPIPADCVDGFLGAYWRRPHAYLDEAIRSGMSSFSRTSAAQAPIEELRRDLLSGAWEREHQHLLDAPELDIGYRLITATLQ